MDKKYLFAIGVAILALVVSGVAIQKTSGDSFSGNTSWQKQSFYEGFTSGNGRQLNVTRVGALTSSALATFSGGLISSGALSSTGTTITDEFTQGGSVLSTSTTATAITFIASDLLTYSTWEVTPNTADLTYTFPATSTLSAIVPSAGDSRTWTIVNATSTATIDVIFASGTGSTIKGSCGGGLTLDEASHGTVKLTRKANSDIVINTCFPTAD